MWPRRAATSSSGHFKGKHLSMNAMTKWGRAHPWQLLVVGLVLLNLACLSYFWAIFHRLQGLRADVRELREDIARDVHLDEVAVAYAETPEGLRRTSADLGLSKADIAFVERFRGHLLPAGVEPATLKRGELIERLRSELLAAFARDPANLELGKTPRQALIAFAVLRTRGSIATYQVRPMVPNDLHSLVLGSEGNCSDFTVRLMMVLESIGLRAATVSSYTPNLQGHVVVDAYDPEEDAAYLLDSTFSVVMSLPHSGRLGFLETVLRMRADERKRFAETVDIRAFPDYYRFVDPGDQGLTITPLTDNYINQQMSKRVPMWRKWLAQDTKSLALWWKNTPDHMPRTLSEFRRDAVDKIPQEFDRSGDYAERLRATASRFLAGQSPAFRGS
jgi:hypothetical protein